MNIDIKIAEGGYVIEFRDYGFTGHREIVCRTIAETLAKLDEILSEIERRTDKCCDHCGGSGDVESSGFSGGRRTCTHCRGSGRVQFRLVETPTPTRVEWPPPPPTELEPDSAAVAPPAEPAVQPEATP